MKHSTDDKHIKTRLTKDMGRSFGQFADEVLRGRTNHTILNTSAGLAALHIGIPDALNNADATSLLMNNKLMLVPGSWDMAKHPLFDFSAEDFTFFGLDFPNMWRQIEAAFDSNIIHVSDHIVPIYKESIGSTLGLPDLPYGEFAHFMHIGMGLYDTGRTFQDLWNNPDLHHNVWHIMTHPDMAHTVAHKGTMLTVMGLLHPLGPAIAIGVAYLCAHLVHCFFELLDDNRAAFQRMKDIPVISAIYDHTGIKEWAEAKQVLGDKAPMSDYVPDMPAKQCDGRHAKTERLQQPEPLRLVS